MSLPTHRYQDVPPEPAPSPPKREERTNEDAQREHDLDAARLLSHSNTDPLWMNDGEAPMAAPLAAPLAGMKDIPSVAKRFYQQNAASSTSLDSQSHFIDHRNQSHSLSVNPNSPLAIRAAQGAESVHAQPDEQSKVHQRAAPAPGNHPLVPLTAHADNVPPAWEPPVDNQELAQSTHTSDSRPLEDDVCFPAPNQVEQADDTGRRGPMGRETKKPGYPFTFDLSVLDAFANEEQEQHNGPGSWPHTSLSFGSPTSQEKRGSMGFTPFAGTGLTGGDATLYSRRPRRGQAAGLERVGGGGKYQKKLAMFEGGHSVGRSPDAPLQSITSPSDKTDETAQPLLQGAAQPAYNGATSSQWRVPPIARPQPMHRGPRSTVPIPGAVHDKPYRFSFYSNAMSSAIHARYLYELPGPGQTFEDLIRGVPAENDKLAEPKQPASNLPPGIPFIRGSNDDDPEINTWWLDVLCPTDQEMKILARTFGIHPLTTEDILMEETREKIELFRNYYLVCFRSFDQDPYSPTYLEPLNMYIVVFREGTLSFHFRHTPHPHNVRRRIKQLKDYINVTADWISYALIDDITDAFAPLIQSIEFEVDSIDELVLILKEAEQSDMLRRIGTCRKKVMGLLRLMGNKADVIKGLAKRSNEYWSVAPKSDIGMYLSDIQDHLITMTQNLNHYEMILSRSHSNYLAQISIEMTDANNQINDVLSKLTALGTIIVPMNVITGLWGMNVRVPGQGIENLNWFGGICTAMVIIAVTGYITTVRYLSNR